MYSFRNGVGSAPWCHTVRPHGSALRVAGNHVARFQSLLDAGAPLDPVLV